MAISDSILNASTMTQLIGKSQRLKTPEVEAEVLGYEKGQVAAIPPHSLGIKPLGNAYTTENNVKPAAGLFAALPDEVLIQVLELDDLWKSQCIDNLTREDFTASWTDKPFILTSPVKQWPIYQTWSIEHLQNGYGDIPFRAESVIWPLTTYLAYMQNNFDESPLYLFDHTFVSKMSLTVSPSGSYAPPPCFGEDLFSVLGPHRPDHRWLIIGPERSGSTFHKDPNATSAWNTVIRGAKYWIMFPSRPGDPLPPGVFVSDDQSEVTSPLSITEWLLSFHAQARRTPGCIEGICAEGEVLHVPSGWWHLVVNLEASIAITQNFVPEAHLAEVLDFLKNKPEQVSGFAKEVASPYGLFVEKLREMYPELLRIGMEGMERRRGGRKRKWNELVNGHDESDEGTVFNFAFGDRDDEDVP
ncbi:MAG: hypothetical protein Q9217_003036 [Psora testacea]